jgi:hypothetical protein
LTRKTPTEEQIMTELQTPAREISSADVEAYLAAGGKVTLGQPAVAPGADAPNVKIAASRSRRQAPAPQEQAPLGEGEPEPQESAPPSSEEPELAAEESESRELAPAPSAEVQLTQAILAEYQRGISTDAILRAIEGAGVQQPEAAASATKTGKIPDYRKLKLEGRRHRRRASGQPVEIRDQGRRVFQSPPGRHDRRAGRQGRLS